MFSSMEKIFWREFDIKTCHLLYKNFQLYPGAVLITDEGNQDKELESGLMCLKQLFVLCNWEKKILGFSSCVDPETDDVMQWHSGRCQSLVIRPWYELVGRRLKLASLIWHKCCNPKDTSFNKVSHMFSCQTLFATSFINFHVKCRHSWNCENFQGAGKELLAPLDFSQ